MHFGYIYGVALIGCVGLWAVRQVLFLPLSSFSRLSRQILTLMSSGGVSLGRTTSVLGYCLLPMVALAAVSLILDLTYSAAFAL